MEPSATLAVVGKAKKLKAEGKPVISFGAGEPDFNSPSAALTYAKEAMDRGETHYTVATGIPRLKELVADYYKNRFNVKAKQEQVIVGAGAKPLIYEALACLLDPEDEVLVFSPAWVSYVEQIRLCEGKEVIVDTSDTEFVPSIEKVRQAITGKTVGMILNTPNNPTGAVYDEKTLIELAKLAKEKDLWIIYDEIYERLVYENESHHCILSLDPEIEDRTILINGVSKAFAMTGWRIGYAVAPTWLASKMGAFQGHLTSNPCSIAQWAAIGRGVQMDSRFTSCCPHDCPDSCPMIVQKIDHETVELSGNPKFPMMGGGWICKKGKRWEHRIRSPKRLKVPLMKDGSGWKEIPWRDAITLWASKVQDAISSEGPLSNFIYQGAGSLYYSKKLFKKVFVELGGYTEPKGSLCGSAGGAGLKRAFGFTPTYKPENLQYARGVLFWGRNAVETHPHLLPILKDLRTSSGVKIGALEIRRTPTTDFADVWWSLMPGSDGALAALLCKKLLERKDCCPSWRRRAKNDEDFERAMEGLDENKLLKLTGLEELTFESIYSWLLDNGPVAIYAGYGPQRYMSGSCTFHLLVALALLLGAFDSRGAGVVFGKNEDWMFPEEIIGTAPIRRRVPIGDWFLNVSNYRPKIKTATFTCCNPAKQSPGRTVFERALSEIPFKVCIDIEMSETAQLCDLVLPSACFLEEGPDWLGSWWHGYLLRSEKVLNPPGQALPETAIFTLLAKHLGLNVDLEEARNTMDQILKKSPLVEQVSEGIYLLKEKDSWCEDPALEIYLPDDLSMIEGNGKTPGKLRLVSVHSSDFINGQIFGVKEPEFPEIFVSEKEALDRGIKDNDMVLLTVKGIDLKGLCRIDKTMDSGYCVIVQGYSWVNELTTPAVSPGYGVPFHESTVTLRKL